MGSREIKNIEMEEAISSFHCWHFCFIFSIEAPFYFPIKMRDKSVFSKQIKAWECQFMTLVNSTRLLSISAVFQDCEWKENLLVNNPN
jgi:hypothetical protein